MKAYSLARMETRNPHDRMTSGTKQRPAYRRLERKRMRRQMERTDSR